MEKDEVLEMARQAGSIDSEDVILTVYNAFALAEREACAKVCEQTDDNHEGPDTWDWHSKDYAKAIRARSSATSRGTEA